MGWSTPPGGWAAPPGGWSTPRAGGVPGFDPPRAVAPQTGARWQSPPNWPAPPAGWTPPPGWQPPAEWGQAPPGWQFWREDGPRSTRAPSTTRRNWLIGGSAAALVLLVVAIAALTGGGDDGDPGTAVPAARSTPTAAPLPGLSARPTLPTRAPTPQRSDPAAVGSPDFAPIRLEGTGDRVVPLTKPDGVRYALVYVQGNAAGRFFSVKAIGSDGQPDFLVNSSDPYQGVRPLDVDRRGDATTTSFDVQAQGPWVIEVRPLSSARSFDADIAGSGSDVLLYTGKAGAATVTGNAAGSYFGVQAIGARRDLLVNATEPYSGQRPIAAGPLLVDVDAEGEWSIAVE